MTPRRLEYRTRAAAAMHAKRGVTCSAETAPETAPSRLVCADLAQKYPDEFPAYLAKTARLIPGVRSRAAAHALAWAGLLVSFYLQINCGAACGM